MNGFRAAILRCNAMDLTSGGVNGHASGLIVKSFTDDITMPLFDAFFGGFDFPDRSLSASRAVAASTWCPGANRGAPPAGIPLFTAFATC